MFDNLRDAFREAIKNFNEELHRDELPGTVDDLLDGMRGEVAQARAHVRRLEDDLGKSKAELDKTRSEVETARRREKMARGIGDEETARVAADYAARQERRLHVLELKVKALHEERELKVVEVEEMVSQVEEASERRSELGADLGRAHAQRTMGHTEDLLSELDRLANMDLMGEDPTPPPRRPSDADLNARLEDLKRRMGDS